MRRKGSKTVAVEKVPVRVRYVVAYTKPRKNPLGPRTVLRWDGAKFSEGRGRRYLTRFAAEREAVRAVMMDPGKLDTVDVQEITLQWAHSSS